MIIRRCSDPSVDGVGRGRLSTAVDVHQLAEFSGRRGIQPSTSFSSCEPTIHLDAKLLNAVSLIITVGHTSCRVCIFAGGTFIMHGHVGVLMNVPVRQALVRHLRQACTGLHALISITAFSVQHLEVCTTHATDVALPLADLQSTLEKALHEEHDSMRGTKVVVDRLYSDDDKNTLRFRFKRKTLATICVCDDITYVILSGAIKDDAFVDAYAYVIGLIERLEAIPNPKKARLQCDFATSL